jgi:hypothetical protein
MLPGDPGGPVSGTVVDDEQVGAGKPGSELVENGREVLLLVPGRDEDERVGAIGHHDERTGPSVGLATIWAPRSSQGGMA